MDHTEAACATWQRAGISRSYYYQIRNRSVVPSNSVSLKLYDVTGEKYGILEGLEAFEIEKLRGNVEER